MNDIRFVYFDLDDTLLDHRLAERAALQDTCAAFPALAPLAFEQVHSTYHRHNVALWTAFSNGAISRDELKKLRFERLLADLELDTTLTDAANAHYMGCYARHWHLPDAAWQAFEAIAARHPVGLLTNGFADVQHAKLDRFPRLRDALSTLVISEEVGVMKPHRAIFDHAAAQAQTPPHHILYVGDSLNSDVRGALDAGWQAAWYGGRPEAAPESVLCFDTWPTLVSRLIS